MSRLDRVTTKQSGEVAALGRSEFGRLKLCEVRIRELKFGGQLEVCA